MEPIELDNTTTPEPIIVRGKTIQWLLRAMAPQISGRNVWRRGVSGQSLVEFALSLPFLMTLLLALLEIGFLIRSHLTIIYATREGARSEAAAGNTPPTIDGSPVSIQNQAQYYTMSDGDTVMINNVNAALQDERPNTLFLSAYKADSSYGDPCQPKYIGKISVDNGNNTCSFTAAGFSSMNYNNWPVAYYNPNNAANPPLDQEVFQRAGAPTYGFTRLLMDGTNSSQSCPSQAPYRKWCGSNSNTLPIPSNGWVANPWYPGLRCDTDPSQPQTGATAAKVGGTSNGSNNVYYNADSNVTVTPVTRDWIGVRIDYEHHWFTAFFSLQPLVLTDHSVYDLEPISQTNNTVFSCVGGS